MKPYEYKRIYHPKLVRFVYKHKGPGIIVDNIFKPAKSIMSSIFKKFAKPIAKKAVSSAASAAGEKIGKAAAEKSGDLIMKRLGNIRKSTTQKAVKQTPTLSQRQESTDKADNSFFEVQFQVQLLADGGHLDAQRATIINGSHSLISHIMIKSAGKIVYDTDNLHKVTFVKNLLEYSDDYSRSVAKESFWYLDTIGDELVANTGFEARRVQTRQNRAGDAPQDVNVIIPLNRYSFFEELESRMLPGMQLQFNIELQNDDELIFKAGAVDDCRVFVNRLLLWVPKLTPRDSIVSKFVDSF